jgi:hypothetical protein
MSAIPAPRSLALLEQPQPQETTRPDALTEGLDHSDRHFLVFAIGQEGVLDGEFLKEVRAGQPR